MTSQAFGQHTWSNDVGRDMPSLPLDSTHDRTTSGMACQHCLKVAHTVKRCRAWHDITAFGQHTRSNDIRHDMPSQPLDSTHGRRTLLMACHHHLWKAQKVGRCRPRHAIVAFGQHTRSNYVERGMPSSHLGSTNGRTTSGVACHHHFWEAHMVKRRRAWHASIALRQQTQSKDIGRGMTLPPFDSTHGRTR